MEVVIALAILSISLLSLIRLHITNISMTDSAEITAQATCLAQEKIAEILAAGFPAKGSDRGIVENRSLLFDWHTEVEEIHLPQIDREDISGLRKISVDVSWKQGIRRKHLQMSTLIADRKLP